MFRSLSGACSLAAVLVSGGVTLLADSPSGSAPYRELVDRYCVTCHNQKLKTGGLMIDRMDLDHVSEGAETWEKVIRKLRGGMMPPQGMPRSPARSPSLTSDHAGGRSLAWTAAAGASWRSRDGGAASGSTGRSGGCAAFA